MRPILRLAIPVASLLALHAAMAWADDKRPTLSWAVLGQAGIVKQQDRFVPQFPKEVVALDQKQVKLQGFMMPLDAAAKQQRFLLTAVPSDCGFCMPGGPEQLVEVQAKSGMKYVLDAIVVSGKLALLRDDANGLFYRLTEAVAVEK
jgi:hypothetical protein